MTMDGSFLLFEFFDVLTDRMGVTQIDVRRASVCGLSHVLDAAGRRIPRELNTGTSGTPFSWPIPCTGGRCAARAVPRADMQKPWVPRARGRRPPK
jgi:hypothetical protein